MGNTLNNQTENQSTQQLIQLHKKRLSLLYETQSGQVLSLVDSPLPKTQASQVYDSHISQTDKLLFHRSISFPNQDQMLKAYKNLQVYIIKQKNLDNSEICEILEIHKNSTNAICSRSYSIDIYIQYSETTLRDQILARTENGNQFFDIEDCCKIITTGIEAIRKIEMNLTEFKTKACENILSRVFINPNRILLMSSGMIKVVSPLMVSLEDRFQYKSWCYYSPEKMSDFDFEDDCKSCIFELGITLVHLFTLKDCHDIYNGFEIMEDVIDNKISQIWSLYQNKDVCILLTKMTRVFRPNRANLQFCISQAKHIYKTYACSYPARKNSYPDITKFYLNSQVPISQSIPSGRSGRYSESSNDFKNDKVFPKQKMGLLKKFKKAKKDSNCLIMHPERQLRLEDINDVESYNNFSHEKQSSVYGHYFKNNKFLGLGSDQENQFFRNKMKVEPVNKENINENDMKQSIVKSRTKFCKKQNPISLSQSVEKKDNSLSKKERPEESVDRRHCPKMATSQVLERFQGSYQNNASLSRQQSCIE